MGSFYGGGGNPSGEIGTAAEERLNAHLLNEEVYITNQERENWNNKVTVEFDQVTHSLIFSKEAENDNG